MGGVRLWLLTNRAKCVKCWRWTRSANSTLPSAVTSGSVAVTRSLLNGRLLRFTRTQAVLRTTVNERTVQLYLLFLAFCFLFFVCLFVLFVVVLLLFFVLVLVFGFTRFCFYFLFFFLLFFGGGGGVLGDAGGGLQKGMRNQMIKL